MRLDSPIGTLLLLWPTLWALWLASDGRPDGRIVWIFALGTLLMRSAGCVMNDLADWRYDAHVERTRQPTARHGSVSRREAWILASVLTLASFGLFCRSTGSRASVIRGARPRGDLSPDKRFLAIPQAYLGIAFGFGIPMGYAAILGTFRPRAGGCSRQHLLGDRLRYRIRDGGRDDDLRIGIKTAAITLGRYDVLAVMISYGVMLALLAGIACTVA